MSGIWAKSILASEHARNNDRLDAILCRFPRCILAEQNTHRALSKNTASSRAIPIVRIIEQVINDPFIPEVWTKNQPGMQGYEMLTGNYAHLAEETWLDARATAVSSARKLNFLDAHKQIVNRLLEPWMWTIQLISGTNTGWENYFELRDHPAAEPHIQILAKAIRKAREEATIQRLEPGEWHLPFITDEERAIAVLDPNGQQYLREISVARCASTSYKTVDGFDMTAERAQKIYQSLLSKPLHASPFEHVAQADSVYRTHRGRKYNHPEDHRNFHGFRQLRAFIERGSHGI